MKRLLALSALLIPIYLFAQGFGSFSGDQPFLAKDVIVSGGGGGLCNTNAVPDPATNTIFSWWVASDYTGVPGSLNTNFWFDRMACNPFKAVSSATAASYTNSALGMFSWSSADPGTGLTNNPPLSAGTNATYAIIFRSETAPVDGLPRLLWSPADLSDATQLGNPRGLVREAGQELRWGTTFRGGLAITLPIATNSPYWIDLIMVQSNAIAYFYTNGVLSTFIATVPPAGGWPFKILFRDNVSAAEHFVGHVREMAAWSNTVFTATSISNYHYYATNTYSYTP